MNKHRIISYIFYGGTIIFNITSLICFISKNNTLGTIFFSLAFVLGIMGMRYSRKDLENKEPPSSCDKDENNTNS